MAGCTHTACLPGYLEAILARAIVFFCLFVLISKNEFLTLVQSLSLVSVSDNSFKKGNMLEGPQVALNDFE